MAISTGNGSFFSSRRREITTFWDPATLDQLVGELTDTITGMGLQKGTETSLVNHLTLFHTKVVEGQRVPAQNQLRVFRQTCVNNPGNKLTADQQNLLIAKADTIVERVGFVLAN